MSVHAREYITNFLKNQQCRGIRVTDKEIICSCPFHNPMHNRNSFSICWNDYKEVFPFHCFSCGVSGNLVSLISRISNIQFSDAIEIVKKFAAVDVANINNIIREYNHIYEQIRPRAKYCQLPPKFHSDKPMVDYIKKRKIQNKSTLLLNYIIANYKLYYCNEGEYFGRIIMPIYEFDELKGFNNRSVFKNGLKTKYDKGSNMSDLLYGFDEANESKVIIVEGAFDVYQVESAIKRVKELREYCCIALMSCQINDIRATKISIKYREAIIMLDKDRAGIQATSKIVKALRKYMKVSLANLSYLDGNDPGNSSLNAIKNSILNSTTKSTTLGILKQKINV